MILGSFILGNETFIFYVAGILAFTLVFYYHLNSFLKKILVRLTYSVLFLVYSTVIQQLYSLLSAHHK